MKRLEHNHHLGRRSGGVGTQSMTGPYRYSGSVRIYRFETRNSYLRRFRADYLLSQLEGSGIKIDLPKDDCVYLVRNDFDEVRQVGEQLLLKERSLQFQIPVNITLTSDLLKRKEDVTLKASIPVFSFGSFMENVITSNELRGPNMLFGDVLPWDVLGIDDMASSASSRLLTDLKILTTPNEHAQSKLSKRSVLKVYNKRPEDLKKVSIPASCLEQGDDLRVNDVDRRISPLNYLLNLMAWKQFPLNRVNKRACYQAMEYINRQIVDVTDDRLDPGACVEQHWDSEDTSIDPEEKARLESCSLFLDYTPDLKNVVRQLGLYYTGVFRSENGDDGWGDSLFYEVKPSAYMRLNLPGKGEQACSMLESRGNTLCYRTSTRSEEGRLNGWYISDKFLHTI